MKNAFWFIVGVAVGAVAAHQYSRTEQGAQFFDEVDNRAREFGSAVIDGYKQREAELRAAVAEAEDTIADLSNKLK
ncbi:MAG: hypothetical protein ACXIUP_02060 [Microcella sp.]